MSNFLIKLSNFLFIQTVLFLVSAPILIYWGLPLSILSFIGNFIFIPFLSIFLGLSIFIFISEILYIPNIWLINFYNIFTKVWLSLLSYRPSFIDLNNFLITIPKNQVLIFSIGAILVILLLIFQDKKKFKRSLLIISLSLITYTGINKIINLNTYNYLKITSNKDNNFNLEIKSNKNKLTIIDNNFLNNLRNPENWIMYNLRSILIKKFGTIQINKFILSKPKKKILNVINKNNKFISINKIIIN